MILFFFCNTHTCVRAVKCTDAHRQRQCTHRCCRACQDFGFSFLTVVSPCVSTVWKTLSLSAALLFCVHRALGENKIQTSVGEKIPRRKRENRKIVLKELSSWKFGEEKQTSQETFALKFFFFFFFLPISSHKQTIARFCEIFFLHVSEMCRICRKKKISQSVGTCSALDWLWTAAKEIPKRWKIKKKENWRVDWEGSNLSAERRGKKIKIKRMYATPLLPSEALVLEVPFCRCLQASSQQKDSGWAQRGGGGPSPVRHQPVTRIDF